jgi:hypothetical protein
VVASTGVPSKTQLKPTPDKARPKPLTGISSLDEALLNPSLGKPVTLQGVAKAIEQTLAAGRTAETDRPKNAGKSVP